MITNISILSTVFARLRPIPEGRERVFECTNNSSASSLAMIACSAADAMVAVQRAPRYAMSSRMFLISNECEAIAVLCLLLSLLLLLLELLLLLLLQLLPECSCGSVVIEEIQIAPLP